MKVLVLGGYGNFGARICSALCGDPSIELFIGGRSHERSAQLASKLGNGARGVALDHTAHDFVKTLQGLGIELLIHTAGPFQAQAYGVAQAAASAGAHYVDLSDGRRFVCDFPKTMHASFHAANRTAICGASTVPALSSAVVDNLSADWQSIDTIDMCIAPAQTAPRGKATIAGVLSYCGELIKVWDSGQWQAQRGWAKPVPVEFVRLRSRMGALCDIPDLELFVQRYGVTDRVMFRAAVELGFVQRVLGLLASLREAKLMVQPARLAGLFNFVAPVTDFLGSSLGGMVVRVKGTSATGQKTQKAWHIAADNDSGPEIPCMAAILLAKKLARGDAIASGAFACMGMLQLAEFETEFARWGMLTDVVEEVMAHGA